MLFIDFIVNNAGEVFVYGGDGRPSFQVLRYRPDGKISCVCRSARASTRIGLNAGASGENVMEIGSVFVAVTDGVVDFLSREDVWNRKVNDGATRGGLAVAIIGDDGVRYYGSHLSQVADGITPGVRVIAGQQLGLTGKSGDARFTDAHPHFGISHPTTPDDWEVRRGEISPYNYLRAWQRGEDAIPRVQS